MTEQNSKMTAIVESQTLRDMEVKGDLLFEDVQLQSKLAYVNDLFSNNGISFLLARKSDLIGFTSVVGLVVMVVFTKTDIQSEVFVVDGYLGTKADLFRN